MNGLRIADAIDMHCHFGPDTLGGDADAETGRAVSGVDAAREALASGHRALVLKSHSFASPITAAQIEQMVPGLRVFGGICLDHPSGGLNVAAVDAALRVGAKIVWLPTLHSHQDWLNGVGKRLGTQGQGLKVIDASGNIKAEVSEIFDLVHQHGAILATGHITADEHYAVARAFARRGKVLVTHAGEHMAGPCLTPAQCRDLADLGATIELTALSCNHAICPQATRPEDMVDILRQIGTGRCTLATDYGWSDAIPHPAAALGDFLERLWQLGLSEEELTTMVSRTPAQLLEL
jgi:hypothetical protein